MPSKVCDHPVAVPGILRPLRKARNVFACVDLSCDFFSTTFHGSDALPMVGEMMRTSTPSIVTTSVVFGADSLDAFAFSMDLR